jgi:hypothetical protein
MFTQVFDRKLQTIEKRRLFIKKYKWLKMFTQVFDGKLQTIEKIAEDVYPSF